MSGNLHTTRFQSAAPMVSRAATQSKRKKTAAKSKVKTGAAKKFGDRMGKAGKAEGDAPVRAYIEALSGWKKDIAKRFDALVEREVPNLCRAVKWSAPFYGVEGNGWFAAFGAFKDHVKINFFRGTSLKPMPPSGEAKLMRSLDIRESDGFDEKQIASWVRQAAKLPGWAS